MDKFRIDSHKLIYHVDRVNDWLKGGNIYPLYTEIATSGTCNHRCTYCALDYMEYERRFLDTQVLKNRISELADLGLKSVMYAGEGEPLLHRDIGEIINHTKEAGIDVALTTNGTLLDKKLLETSLHNITWIKVSINGATPETYSKVHRTSEKSLDVLLRNMRDAVQLRKDNNLKCTLGMQLLLLPENWHEAELLTQKAKEIGMDYLVIKPYSQHPFSKTTMYKDIRYSDYMHLDETLKGYNSETFNVIFRLRTMQKWDSAARTYDRCRAVPFWSYIDAGGNVWGCSAYLGDKRFLYGNINESSFKEIWEGERRRESLEILKYEVSTDLCRVNCRMDEINRYLWELEHPPEHVNFI